MYKKLFKTNKSRIEDYCNLKGKEILGLISSQSKNSCKKATKSVVNSVKKVGQTVSKYGGRIVKGTLGVVQTAAGAAQVYVGGALCATGIGAVIGVPLMVHGAADVVQGVGNTYYAIKGEDKEMPNFVQEGYKTAGRTIGRLIGGEKGAQIGEKIGSGAFFVVDTALSFVSGKAILDSAKAAKGGTTFFKGTQEVLKATGKNMVTNVKGTFKAIKELPGKVTGNFKKTVATICDGGACFVAGTLVLTETGLRPIEGIQVGEYVWSENPVTHEKGLKRVAQTFVHEKDLLVYVYVNDEVIKTTEEHPFWVEGQGWIGASKLQQGETLRLQNNTKAVVEKVEIVETEETTVYNFEVEDWHTYYVSEEGILVHNLCEAGKARVKANIEASKAAREASNFSDYAKAEKNIGKEVSKASLRYQKGTVTGSEALHDVEKMMRGSQGNIGVIPKEIGDKLQGQTFNNFDEFRKELWKEIGNSKYADEFAKGNQRLMKNGNAPFAVVEQWSGKTGKYAIHHKTPIHAGGGVYDLDNIVIVTPRMHLDILDRNYHFNK